MKRITCKYNKEKIGIIFLICLFVCGLLAVFSYGAHLDQTTEQEILYSNVKTYLRHFGFEESAFYRELESQGIADIAESIDRYNGMAVYYPVCWIFYLNRTSPYIGNIVWHTYIWLITFCGAAALFCLIRELFGGFRIPAITTALFFSRRGCSRRVIIIIKT